MPQMKCKFTPFTPGRTKSLAKPAKASSAAAVVGFNLTAGDKDSLTIYGLDVNGNDLDISGQATLAITSDKPALLTVDAVTGMTTTMHGIMPTPPPAPGTDLGIANLLPVVTFNPVNNAPSPTGPFSITFPVDCQVGAVAGIVLVPGVPTVG